MRKNKAQPVVISLLIFLLAGCEFFAMQPTYSKEKIVESITTLCRNEYNIEPKVQLLVETVWIYIPLPRLITKEVQWDKDILEKVNKVMMGASRVLLSMKPRPQFMEIIASDTGEYGIDYTIITWIPDIVKYQLQLISRDEFFRRNVIKIKESPQAIGDLEGTHIEKRAVKIKDFLADQIVQRIQLKFSLDPGFKDFFKVTGVKGEFRDDGFRIKADIIQLKPVPGNDIDIQKEILKIIAYVVKDYEFKDFLVVELENSAAGEKSVLTRLALKDYLR